MMSANNTSAHFLCECNPGSINQRLLDIARFMREDPDNVVFRRFENLHLLNILSIQHELIEYSKSVSLRRRSGGYGDLREIFLTMRPLLESYGRALTAYEQIQARHKTPLYVRRALEAKAQKKREPSLALELDPEDGWSDLMTLTATEKGVIHRFIDSSLKLKKLYRRTLILEQRTHNTEQDNSEKGQETAWIPQKESGFFYYSESAVRFTEELIIKAILFGIITLPIIALSFISGKMGKLFMIVACVVLLTSLVSALVPGKVQRSNLTLMLAYAAILVVFLNYPNGGD